MRETPESGGRSRQLLTYIRNRSFAGLLKATHSTTFPSSLAQARIREHLSRFRMKTPRKRLLASFGRRKFNTPHARHALGLNELEAYGKGRVREGPFSAPNDAGFCGPLEGGIFDHNFRAPREPSRECYSPPVSADLKGPSFLSEQSIAFTLPSDDDWDWYRKAPAAPRFRQGFEWKRAHSKFLPSRRSPEKTAGRIIPASFARLPHKHARYLGIATP